MCHVFPPLVSLVCFLSLYLVIYELILVQLCLSNYLWLSCVLIFLSVQFDFIWSTRYSPVFLCVCLAFSCPDVYIKDCLSLSSSPFSLFLPRVCTVTITNKTWYFIAFLNWYVISELLKCFCHSRLWNACWQRGWSMHLTLHRTILKLWSFAEIINN